MHKTDFSRQSIGNVLYLLPVKTLKKIFLLLFACLFPLYAFAEAIAIPDTILEGLSVRLLPNGFLLAVAETPSSAMVSIGFACRAGYAVQNAANAGFPELYAKLFPRSAKDTEIEIASRFGADRALYTAAVGREGLEACIAAFADCAMRPSFSDEAIAAEYERLKDRVASYQGNDAAFINGAIEACLFPDCPWKESFGTDSEVFSSYSKEQLRPQLLAIRQGYYTPDNCALFVSGNADFEEIYRLVQKYFGSWQGVYTGSAGPKNMPPASQRKFVLSLPSFSPSLIQTAVQFTSLSEQEAAILNAAFSAEDSQHFASSYSVQQNGVRLILQSVVEAAFTPDSPDLFIQKIKEAARLSPEQLERAQNKVLSDFLFKLDSDTAKISELADFWALHPQTGADKFASNIIEEKRAIYDVTGDSLAKTVDVETPFVFVLLNDEVYAKAAGQLLRSGYTAIDREHGAWYKDTSYSISDSASTEKSTVPPSPVPREDSSYSRYYIANARTVSSAKLANGIPLIVKTNKGSQTVSISIAIAGGEMQSPAGQRKLRTVLINAFTNCIHSEIKKLRKAGKIAGVPKLSAWTAESQSYISIECLKDDVGAVLGASADAIIYGEIQPMLADSLIKEQKEQWLSQITSPSFLLRARAMQVLYWGTAIASQYDTDAPILQGCDFQELSLAYTQLLNASLYSLVLVGDINPKAVRQEAELSFGMLKAQAMERNPVPRPRELKTAISLAGKVEISEQLYFPAPVYGTQRELFNALLFTLAGKNESREASAIIQAGMIACSEEAYRTAREDLRRKLSDGDTAPACLQGIRSKWNSRTLIKTQTNSGTAELIQDGLIDNYPALYLDAYLVVSHAAREDFLYILDAYFPATAPLRIHAGQ